MTDATPAGGGHGPWDSRPRGLPRGFSFPWWALPCLLLVASCLPGEVRALTFPLPQGGNTLVGRIQYVTSREEDTLLDIARRYDVGYNEMLAANPGVDPWLPGEGTRVRVPTRFILPPRPWQGIIVNLVEMRLYYFPEHGPAEPGTVVTYPIGIGREGWSTPVGEFSLVDKIEKPSWTAPLSIVEEMATEGVSVRRIIPPGPDNPLGEFALMLSEPGYFLHGTNRPFSIGMRVSHGCLRLYPEDIEELFAQVPRKAPVRIINESYKVGVEDGVLYLEAHVPLSEQRNQQGVNLTPVVKQLVEVTSQALQPADWDRIAKVIDRHSGVPAPILAECTQPGPARDRLLQVGAFRERGHAERLATRLRASLPAVRVRPCDGDGWCRVTVGPFDDCLALRTTAQAIMQEFGIEALVVDAQESAKEHAVIAGPLSQGLRP